MAEFRKVLSDHGVKLASVLPMYRWASLHEDERLAAVGDWKEAIRATVEHERDPRNVGGSLADVKASRDYLSSVGF